MAVRLGPVRRVCGTRAPEVHDLCGASSTSPHWERNVQVICRTNVTQRAKSHGAEVRSQKQIAPFGAPQGSQVHRTDIPVFLREMQGVFVPWEPHAIVVGRHTRQIRHDEFPVEDGRRTDRDAEQRMYGRIVLPDFI